MPLLSLTQNKRTFFAPTIESDCFFYLTIAPTIVMEILSNGDTTSETDAFPTPFL